MKLASDTFSDGGIIPKRCAFGKIDLKTHVALSENRNPHLAWSGLPAATQSLALLCHDRDVPSKADDVNQEGRQIPASLPRVDFYHWVLVDLDAKRSAIAEGEFCSGITPRGKPGPQAPGGARHGINDYTAWFAADADMKGDYYGYDGPCPPWNDSLVHHYVFTLYALSEAKCPVVGRFGGAEALAAIQGRILGRASLTGLYVLNPAVKY